MPASEAARRVRPHGEVRLTLALWLALMATLVPLLRVLQSGSWVPGSAVLCAALLACGFVLRRTGRVPAVGVTLAELGVWVLAVTGVFLPGPSLLGVIPTGGALAEAAGLVQAAGSEIFLGVAPLAPTTAMSFVVVASLGLLTIALDHVVVTARMPLLAGVALVLVWLIPAIAVPAEVDVVAFVVMSAAILWLIRAETRTREEPAPIVRAGGVTAVAVTIGAVAIVGALVAGPALPPPPPVTAGGSGIATSIDPSLDLGNDLRRPNDVTVLTVRSSASQMPYLRVATLSLFDGEVWQPDRPRSVPLTEAALEPVVADEGIRLAEVRTDVQITQLSSAYLPVPFPAVAVTGLDGAWRSVPYSRTVLTGDGNAQGQSYEVVSHVPQPTLEQIRGLDARVSDIAVDLYAVPEFTPPVIAETAARITAGATTDYDRLIALQSWFRGPEFTYSLTAPVDDGFDDAGVDAVAAFLELKSGYCVHFAGAFALMARTLGMPSRIVVGFLPGTATSETVDGERVAEVTSGQLHAWPEVHFDGVGWIAFEPTKGLGTATQFVSAAETTDSGEAVATPTAAPTPTAAATGGPADRPDIPSEAAGGTSTPGVPWGFLTTLLLTALVAAAPGAAAGIRRLLLRMRGGVGAAWRLLQDAAIDLGVPVPSSESPRAFGARLVARHGAPRAEVDRLVAAVERVSYAPAGSGAAGSGATRSGRVDPVADAEGIRRGMLAAASGRERLRARALPRSLVIRPGSAFADRDALA